MTPITPKGVRTLFIFRPLGWLHSLMTLPIGSVNAAIDLSDLEIPSTRSLSNISLSIIAPDSPLVFAFFISLLFSSKIFVLLSDILSDALNRACCFSIGSALARTSAATLAFLPISFIKILTSDEVILSNPNIVLDCKLTVPCHLGELTPFG